jgi:hypothetical protein
MESARSSSTAEDQQQGLSAEDATTAAIQYWKDLSLQVRRSEPSAKRIAESQWQKPRPLTEPAIRAMFQPHRQSNVCSVWGVGSHYLVDAEAETPLGARALDLWLPSSSVSWGSPKNPGSHRLLRIAGEPGQIKTRQLTGPRGRHVIELRGDGAQSILPPSMHPSGAPYAWAHYEPAGAVPEVAYEDVLRACEEAAAATLIAEQYPTLTENRTRHDTALALVDVLLRSGRGQAEAERFMGQLSALCGDEEAQDRIACVRTTADARAAGRPTTGIPTLRQLIDPAIVSCLLVLLRVPTHGRDGSSHCGIKSEAVQRGMDRPEWADGPRRQDLAWPAPLAREAYHGLAGEIVGIIMPTTEASSAVVLIDLLTLCGNYVGRGPHLMLEETWHPPVLFAIVVGETAISRKDSAMQRARRVLREIDPDYERDHIESGLSSGEGLIWAVRDPIYEMRMIKEKGGAPHPERVMVDPGVPDKRLVVGQSECAQALRAMEREGNTLSAILRQFWDARARIGGLVKNSRAVTTEAHVSVLGHITIDELRRLLTDGEAASGYGNRHLWFLARRERVLPRGGRLTSKQQTALAGLAGKLGRILKTARAHPPLEIWCDARAEALWTVLYPALSEGQPGLLGALTNRTAPYVLRIALIYALLDEKTAIGVPHILAAIAIIAYSYASCRYIFGDRTGSPLADTILALLTESGDAGLTRGELYDLLNRHLRRDRISTALEMLRRMGKVDMVIDEDTGGRHAERWRLNALNTHNAHRDPIEDAGLFGEEIPGLTRACDLLTERGFPVRSLTQQTLLRVKREKREKPADEEDPGGAELPGQDAKGFEALAEVPALRPFDPPEDETI